MSMEVLTRIAAALERIATAMEKEAYRDTPKRLSKVEKALLAIAGEDRPTMMSISRATGICRKTLKMPQVVEALDMKHGGTPRRARFEDCTT